MKNNKPRDHSETSDDATQAAYDLVRPGLATVDHGDIGEPLPANLGQQMAAIAAGGDSSASSAEIKKAKLQLPAWRRQEQVLEAFEALGNLTAACDAAGVARKTAEHWRRTDALGFAGRLELARGGFGDRLESLAWGLVKQMKPGNNPTLLICLLNATLPLKYRPAVHLDPVAARDTLSELRQLASAETVEGQPAEDAGARAVAEAERLLGSRSIGRRNIEAAENGQETRGNDGNGGHLDGGHLDGDQEPGQSGGN